MAEAAEAPRARPRLAVLALLGATIALGLLSRRHPLPGILAEYTGDALYAVAGFFALALLRPAARTRALAFAALLLAWAVELSQLLSWAWLQDLRGTRLGALVLGHGFQWADLIAYAIGVSAVASLDAACFGRRVARP